MTTYSERVKSSLHVGYKYLHHVSGESRKMTI